MFCIEGLFLCCEGDVGFIGNVQLRDGGAITVMGCDMEEACDGFVHAEYGEDDGTVWGEYFRRRVGNGRRNQKIVLRRDLYLLDFQVSIAGMCLNFTQQV